MSSPGELRRAPSGSRWTPSGMCSSPNLGRWWRFRAPEASRSPWTRERPIRTGWRSPLGPRRMRSPRSGRAADTPRRPRSSSPRDRPVGTRSPIRSRPPTARTPGGPSPPPPARSCSRAWWPGPVHVHGDRAQRRRPVPAVASVGAGPDPGSPLPPLTSEVPRPRDASASASARIDQAQRDLIGCSGRAGCPVLTGGPDIVRSTGGGGVSSRRGRPRGPSYRWWSRHSGR